MYILLRSDHNTETGAVTDGPVVVHIVHRQASPGGFDVRQQVVPVIQDDLDAFQEPPPKEWPPAFICQVPCMELLETEPE